MVKYVWMYIEKLKGEEMIKRGMQRLVCILTLGITAAVVTVPAMAESAVIQPQIFAEGAVLIEPKTNTVLYEKNGHEALYPASITKILTALIVSEELSNDAVITKSKACIENVPWDSSQIGLDVGDSYSKEEGLYGLLLGSDNFIAYDLACATAGDIQSFAQKMNEKAKSLGAYDSHFVNPHGYQNKEHYTTPYDMAEIARGAFADPTVAKVAGTAKHNFYVGNKGINIPIKNSSRLLKSETPYYNAHVVCCKTGFHDDAKQTLVAKAVYEDIELIAVVMKDDTPTQYEDINRLFEYGRENYSLREVNGAFILDNKTISMEIEKAVHHFKERGWLREGLNFQKPIQTKELVSILKRVKSSQPESYIEEIISLLGLKEDDYVTKEQLATIIMFLNEKWHQANACMDTTVLQQEGLFCQEETINIGKAVNILYCIDL